jgi:phage replication O-like protein O
MADVQPDYGFARIANQILEAMARTKLSGREWCFLSIIWRSTYGWKGRKEARIPLSVFTKVIGIAASDASKILNGLERMGVITKTNSAKGAVISFVKDFDKWTGNAKVSEIKCMNPLDNEEINFNADPGGVGENTNGENTNVGENTNGENTNPGVGKNTNSGVGKNTNSTCPPTLVLMRPAESLKKVLKIVLKKEDEKAPSPEPQNSPISPEAKTSIESSSDRCALAKALGKLLVTDAEMIIWQALKKLDPPCIIADVEKARKRFNKNNLAYLQNMVCEERDKRKASDYDMADYFEPGEIMQ